MDIAALKLFHFPATRSARVKWILHECVGDAFAVERVNLYGEDQYGEDFLRLNPNHSVPVLSIRWSDGTEQTMIESAAIVAFLADAYPQRDLAPPAEHSPTRADYLQMLHFASTSMDMMLWQIRLHEHLLPEAERDAATAGRYREKFRGEVEPQLLERLERHAFICGETFTAADCVAGHNVLWARSYGLCQERSFQRYLARLARRPAFRSAFADAEAFTPGSPHEGADASPTDG